jgi:hypothetical protein
MLLDLSAQNGPKLRRIEGQGNDGIVLDFVHGMHDSILNSANSLYNYPLYDNNAGPVSVDIYDPSLTPSGEFIIIFNDTSANLAGNDLTDPFTKWMLINVPLADTVFGDSVISVDHIQDITAWGMKIRTNPTDDPGQSVYTNNGFLEATMEFQNPALPWLSGLSDSDSTGSENWIHAGTYSSPVASPDDDFLGLDDNEVYEGVLNGTWSPYRLTAHTFPGVTGGPVANPGGPAWDKFRVLTMMKHLGSIDVVITADKSKWTRCPVIELQEDASLAIGAAKKMNLRKSPSVDKNGRKAGDSGYNAAEGGSIDSAGVLVPSPTGMGWFPGYAVNLETGERLNMAFGEDSYFPTENGTDMKWNPTSSVFGPGSIPLFGGKHYIYIFGHNADGRYPSTDLMLPLQNRDIPAYDKGLALYRLFNASENATPGGPSDSYKREIYADAMWVNIPLLNPGYSLLATDVNVRLRVSKQYRQQEIDGTNNTNPKYIFDAGTIAGISMIANEERMSLYPNPATDILYIGMEAGCKNSGIGIYDLSGRLLKNVTMDLQSKQSIDVSFLRNGLYILKINDGKNTRVQRFIKQ